MSKIETIQIETNRDRKYFDWESPYMDFKLFKAFLSVYDSLPSYEVNTGGHVRIVFYNGIGWQRKTVELQQGLALIKLGKEINEGLIRSYQKGKDKGRDLLSGLADGEITTTQYLKG